MSNFTELLGSVVLSEEVRENITAAWEKQIAEAREQVTAELREEFASRYEHDKGMLVEAMDRLINDTIAASSEEFKQLHQEAIDQRVKYAAQVKENSELLEKFVMETLAREIGELKADRQFQKDSLARLEEFALRKLTSELTELNEDHRQLIDARAKVISELKADRLEQKENLKRLEEFALRKLTSELTELHEDHKQLVDARVKLVAEGRKAIEEARSTFIKKASEKVNSLVTETFKKEMTQLKEDIREAKENNFGRKIMEAFAAEFMASKFADGTAVSQLNKEIKNIKAQLEESQKSITEKEVEIAEAKRRQRIAEDRMARARIMQDLTAPLSKDKRAIMEELLESTETAKLKDQFQKYLPSVLNEEVRRDKKQLVEGIQSQKTVITGDKPAAAVETSDTSEYDAIQQIRKLAGIQ